MSIGAHVDPAGKTQEISVGDVHEHTEKIDPKVRSGLGNTTIGDGEEEHDGHCGKMKGQRLRLINILSIRLFYCDTLHLNGTFIRPSSTRYPI